jgi:hypothetical protein
MVRHQAVVFAAYAHGIYVAGETEFSLKCGVTTMGAAWGKILMLTFLDDQGKDKTVPVHIMKVREKMKV